MGWLWSGGYNLTPGPLGSVAGDPNRHRGWLLRTGGWWQGAEARGLTPRVFPAHGPPPQLQVQVHDSVMGRRPIAGIACISRPAQAPFTCLKSEVILLHSPPTAEKMYENGCTNFRLRRRMYELFRAQRFFRLLRVDAARLVLELRAGARRAARPSVMGGRIKGLKG
jgi:hypothetical protein